MMKPTSPLFRRMFLRSGVLMIDSRTKKTVFICNESMELKRRMHSSWFVSRLAHLESVPLSPLYGDV